MAFVKRLYGLFAAFLAVWCVTFPALTDPIQYPASPYSRTLLVLTNQAAWQAALGTGSGSSGTNGFFHDATVTNNLYLGVINFPSGGTNNFYQISGGGQGIQFQSLDSGLSVQFNQGGQIVFNNGVTLQADGSINYKGNVFNADGSFNLGQGNFTSDNLGNIGATSYSSSGSANIGTAGNPLVLGSSTFFNGSLQLWTPSGNILALDTMNDHFAFEYYLQSGGKIIDQNSNYLGFVNGANITGVISGNGLGITNLLGSGMTNFIHTNFTLDFPSTAAGTRQGLPVTIANLGTNKFYNVLIQPSFPILTISTNNIYDAAVTATNTLTIYEHNQNTINAIDPISGRYDVTIIEYP